MDDIECGLSARIAETAIQAAVCAGEMLGDLADAKAPPEKTLPHDLKLEADRLAEDVIIRVIRARFPGHALLSEECGFRFLDGRDGSQSASSHEFLWIVDPLDGTVNFYHGLPAFCASVACYQIGRLEDANGAGPDWKTSARSGLPGAPVAAAIYHPGNRELFSARGGGGASLNGEPLALAPAARMQDELVALNFSHRDGSGARMARILPILLQRVRKVRSFGATASDLCQVAAGRLGALYQWGTNIWDFAAGAFIIEEAGGIFAAERIAAGRWEILAGRAGVFEPLKRLLQDVEEECASSS
jgi:fructose-1,6-bisphosphatase/inositol monophosphatase family enzyme